MQARNCGNERNILGFPPLLAILAALEETITFAHQERRAFVPKEITHWLIAEQAAQRLKDTKKPTTQATMSHSGLVRLGAVLHDVLYYVRSGSAAIKRCTDIANVLHGAQGEDTFEILRIIASGKNQYEYQHETRSNSASRETWEAFLFGAMTHICADVAFHPYIYYTSGNCLDDRTHFQAWENHRALEAAIDLAFCKEHQQSPHHYSLLNDILQHQRELREILTYCAEEQSRRDISVSADDYEQGYKTLAWLRLAMQSVVPNLAINVAEHHFSGLWQMLFSAEMRSYLALRYTNASAWSGQDVFRAIHYQHPVSGEEHQTTLAGLFDEAVEDSVRLWGVLEETLLVEKPLTERGKSLELGLEGVPSSTMTLFALI
ncbi:MAG: zinc dependent phospholipase C family protein [Candidatus Kapabacteria bacterium]|jgi:hypothetical protein|nr:zinc dependent phospholipase C family protein [Candidatus Kapabacteria bacterium]